MPLRSRPTPTTLAALASVAVLAVTSGARAEAPLAWSVRTDAGCGARTAAQFAREAELACDALGKGCRVVGAGELADRRAVLACARAQQWTLEAQRSGGEHLWTVALEEALESRARVAAMWLARAERDAPPPAAKVIAVVPPPIAPAPPPAAKVIAVAPAPVTRAPAPVTQSPPPKLAVEEPTGRPAPVAVESRPPPLPAAVDPPADAERASPSPVVPVRSQPGRHGGLALAARASIAGGLAPGALGVNARAVVGLPLRTTAGLVVAGDRAVGAGSGYTLSTVRLGAAAGWGAPWSADRLGVSLEAGPMLSSLAAPGAVAPASRAFVDGYAQLAVFGQWPPAAAVRPWVALSLAALAAPVHVTEGARDVTTLPQVSAGIDLGVAWSSW